MIAVVDYRMGNIRSVEKGLEAAGVKDVRVSDEPAVVEAADGIVLPGVGAFGDAARNLRDSGNWELLKKRISEGVPFLGICLGLQLLMEKGFENGENEGLGLLAGTCDLLPGGVKVPHMGWNTVEYPRDSRLFEGIHESTAFYFVHSYRVVPRDDSCIIGTTDYGVTFASAIEAGNSWAVQFHPEKSSADGLRLLANFGALAREV